jgi:hypothetical protein
MDAMERLPGDTLHATWGLLTASQRSAVAAQIAEHIEAFHHSRSGGFGGVELDEAARARRWPEFWLPRFRRVLDEARREGSLPGHWADYAREISFMEMFGLGDAEFHERYRAAHELDPGFELRKAIYSLKMHLKHVSMYPAEAYYRRGAETCLRTIERT